MKKFVRRSIFAFVFAFAFLVCGAISVGAAEDALNNTNISGYNATYGALENSYYAMNDTVENAEIKLSSKSAGQYKGLTMKYYTAQVSIVTCEEYNGVEGVCRKWLKYDYNADKTLTMDALKQKKLTLKFDSVDVPLESTEINGVSLGELDSVYSLTDTYFVIVRYTLERWPLADIEYNPDIFRVVFTDELTDLEITSNTNGTKTQLTVKSGVPINTVRYFYSATKFTLDDSFDFQAQFDASGNGIVALEVALTNPEIVNGAYTYSVEIDAVENQNTYVEASDVAGRTSVVNLTTGEENKGGGGTDPNPGDNIGNTDVGKIILISLVVVLVLAVVLVIVQRIIDHKKKLY